jgi:serine/threonine-protein kinase
MNFTCTRCKREVETPGTFCPFCGAPAPAPAPEGEPADVDVGTTIGGKFFVHALLGRSATARVYKATHLGLDRPVALKLLSRSFRADPAAVEAFQRGVAAASRLEHPSCARILDSGQTEDGVPFVATEYLAGRTLAKVLADDFPLGEVRAVGLVGHIVGALAEAHAAGIVHGDLELSKVMVESRPGEPDEVKVRGFGTAAPTPSRREKGDAREDLYAAGTILYELLCGRPPFRADAETGPGPRRGVDTPRAPGTLRPELRISPGLDALVLRILSSAREERPATAQELRELLFTCELAPPEPASPTPVAGIAKTAVLSAVSAPTAAKAAAAPGAPPIIRKYDARPSPAAPAPGPAGKADSPGGTVAIPVVSAPKPAPPPAPPQSTPTPARTATFAPPPEEPAPAARTSAYAPPPEKPAHSAAPKAPVTRPNAPEPDEPEPDEPDETDEEPEADEPDETDEEPEADETPRASRAARPRPRAPAPARPPPRGSKRPTLLLGIAAAAVLVLVLAGVVGWALLRSDPFAVEPPSHAGAAPSPPAGEGPRLQKASPARASQP